MGDKCECVEPHSSVRRENFVFKNLTPGVLSVDQQNMGLSLSCPGDEYGVIDENLEALLMRSIGLKEGDVNMTLRSMSLKGQEADQPTVTRPFGPGKMNMEGPLSSKGREVDSLHSETRSSVKTPRLRELEVSSPCSRCSSFPLDRVMLDAEVGPGSPKYKAALQVQKVYKSFRTRRKLADCAVIVEQSW